MRFTAGCLVAFVYSVAFASAPGQPLDCSDWVILEPGISCVTYIPWPCEDGQGGHLQACAGAGTVGGGGFDNNGGLFAEEIIQLERFNCGCGEGWRRRHQVYRLAAHGEKTVLAYTDERCGPPSAVDAADFAGAAFDEENGRLFISGTSFCQGCGGCTYGFGQWRITLEGFATTFEVLQSYTPQASLGFHVPYMPEGMAAADHLDTYWGPLTKPFDFTHAHPLACDYPATAPHVGDYITVADTVPTPAPGQGVYYVTSATYQGATRYGRKATAGHLIGRDPALLPACTP